MNIADAARFIADGMTMKIELSENVDKKIDAIREEVKEMVNQLHEQDRPKVVHYAGTIGYRSYRKRYRYDVVVAPLPGFEPGLPAPQARVISKLHYKGRLTIEWPNHGLVVVSVTLSRGFLVEPNLLP